MKEDFVVHWYLYGLMCNSRIFTKLIMIFKYERTHTKDRNEVGISLKLVEKLFGKVQGEILAFYIVDFQLYAVNFITLFYDANLVVPTHTSSRWSM